MATLQADTNRQKQLGSEKSSAWQQVLDELGSKQNIIAELRHKLDDHED